MAAESSSGGGGGGAVPESVMEAVNRTATNIQTFESNFTEFLSTLCGGDDDDVDVLSEMDPLLRAQSLLYLTKATTTLFALRLRCNGVHPDDHPVKTELERLSLYQDKLQRFIDRSKEPLQPSIALNYQAAARFIEHSLPDLTPEQRQSMKNISKAEGPKMKYTERNVHKKRRCQTSEKQSVRSAAQEFLEKAARELLGDNNTGIKGPLQSQVSDEDAIHVDD